MYFTTLTTKQQLTTDSNCATPTAGEFASPQQYEVYNYEGNRQDTDDQRPEKRIDSLVELIILPLYRLFGVGRVVPTGDWRQDRSNVVGVRVALQKR